MKTTLLCAAAALILTGCATTGDAPAKAPQPTKTIDAARFYSGTWREIGRLPMKITDGCVAGATEYAVVSATKIAVLDTCRMGSPETGKLKSIRGTGTIKDPGTNAKLSVRYSVFGLPVIVWDYWVLDVADDYSWFISADPKFEKLFIYTRNPVISLAERERLLQRARALGYDVTRLEFPAQPAG